MIGQLGGSWRGSANRLQHLESNFVSLVGDPFWASLTLNDAEFLRSFLLRLQYLMRFGE